MVNVKIVNSNYELKTGLLKTLKNMGVMFGIPAILYFLSNAKLWIPSDYLPVLMPIIGGISYIIKNYLENK